MITDHKPQEREPLLSNEEGWKLCPWTSGRDSWDDPMNAVRDFYEAKITSGELMVVKTVKRSEFVEASAHNLKHKDCPGPGDGWVPKRAMQCEAIAHCPGCGAKIVE